MPIRKISHELISEICGSVRSLSTLNLSRNEISTIENLERLPALSRLDLSHNAIGEIGGLDALGSLAHLDLSSNRIATLAGLEHLAALEVLHLADNGIAAAAALRSLRYLPRLHTITLRGNPLARAANYRADVAGWLPALRTLDGEPVVRAEAEATHEPSSAPTQATQAEAPSAQAAAGPVAAGPAPPRELAAAAAALEAAEARLRSEREHHMRELTAVELRVSEERDALERRITDERDRAELIGEESRAKLAATQAALLQAKEEARERESSLLAQLAAARAEAEQANAASRQLRAYVAARAHESVAGTRPSEAPSAACSTGAQAQPGAAEAQPGAQAAADEHVVDELRREADGLRVERELLTLRLEAMSQLMVTQEEALCAGYDAGTATGHGAPLAEAVEAADAALAATAPGGLAAGGDAAVAMVRGWRVKAYEMLLEAQTERSAARRRAAEDLAALEAGKAELERRRSAIKQLTAQLAVMGAERTAEKISRAEIDSRLSELNIELSECKASLAAERGAASALAGAVQGLDEAQRHAEEKLGAAAAALRPLEVRLAFALGRTAQLSAQVIELRRRAATSEEQAGVAERGCQARVAAADGEARRQVHEARAAAGRWQVEMEAADGRASEAEAKAAELEGSCAGLREALAAADEFRQAHAALISEVQAQAMKAQADAAEYVGEVQAQHDTERAASLTALQDALSLAERERLAAAASAEAVAGAEEAAAAAQRQLESGLAEAAAAAAAAAREAAEESSEREKKFDREAEGLRREATKEAVARRALEREVARLKEKASQVESNQFEYLEAKIASRDAQVAGLTKERNALLSSLRLKQQQAAETRDAAPRDAAPREANTRPAVKSAIAADAPQPQGPIAYDNDQPQGPITYDDDGPGAGDDAGGADGFGDDLGGLGGGVGDGYDFPSALGLFTPERPFAPPGPEARTGEERPAAAAHDVSAVGVAPHAKRRVLSGAISSSLLDELQALSSMLEAAAAEDGHEGGLASAASASAAVPPCL